MLLINILDGNPENADILGGEKMLAELLSGIIGAVLGSIFTVIAQRSSNRTSHRTLIEEHQIQEYLIALDCSFDAINALDDMGRALSGRTEPGPNSSQEEIEESRRRDEESAKAIGKLFMSLDALAKQAYKIQAIGSKAVRDASEGINETVGQYMQSVLDQAMQDGRFIARHHNEATEKLRMRILLLANQIREDIQVDSLFKRRLRKRKVGPSPQGRIE